MKKSKKIKLITTLSTSAAVASAATFAATAFAINTNNTTTVNRNANRSIDITRLTWVKNSYFNVDTLDAVKAQIIEDNNNVFANNEGLYDCVDITVTPNNSTEFTVTIARNDTVNPKYTGSPTNPVTWIAYYNGPTPTPAPEPEPTPTGITKLSYADLVTKMQEGKLIVGQNNQFLD